MSAVHWIAAIAVFVTAYVPSAGGINCWGDCSVTASGYPPTPGMAACGPNWEFGDVLQVECPEGAPLEVICADRGGMVVGSNVDVLMPDLESAWKFGARVRTVRKIGHADIDKWLIDHKSDPVVDDTPPSPKFGGARAHELRDERRLE